MAVPGQANRLVVMLILAGIAMTAWGIATQPKPEAKIPLAVLQKAHEIAQICSTQCTQQETACKNRNLEGCYRAAACRCECSLQHDPAGSSELRQCIARNLEHAEALHRKAASPGARNPL